MWQKAICFLRKRIILSAFLKVIIFISALVALGVFTSGLMQTVGVTMLVYCMFFGKKYA